MRARAAILTFAVAPVLALGLSWTSASHASDDAAKADEPKVDASEALAKQAQNPIANLISVPFQNNTTFDYGPRHGTQNILNIQPVIPFTLSEEWNLISRWILPIVHQPSFAKSDSSDTGPETSIRRCSCRRRSPRSSRRFRPHLSLADRLQQRTRHQEMGRRSLGGLRLDAGPLARRHPCQQHLVLCRPG